MKLTESRRRWKGGRGVFCEWTREGGPKFIKVGVDGNSDRYDESA